MNILFVYPNQTSGEEKKISNFKDKFSSILIDFSENLTFPTLAAVTDKEHEIRLLDNRYEKINFSEDYDIAGITVTTPAAPNAYRIADRLINNGIKVVLGGWHVSALPEEAKEHADSVVIGEADEIWPVLLKDFEEGRLKPFYFQEKPVDIKKIPLARRDIFNVTLNERSLKDARVQASRGCPNNCKFCAITNSVHGRVYRTRNISSVIEEISQVPQKIIRFCDPSLTTNPTFSKELFNEMINLDKKFFCNGNVNILGRDEELLKIANEAGCIGWFVGFDSISPDAIQEIGKKTNKVEDYISTVEKIHDYGMMVDGNFIFGFDEDKKDIFDLTIDFIENGEIDESDFFILTPYPGTPYFEQFEKEGRILTKDWSKYTNEDVVYTPKNMTPEELLDGMNYVKRYYNSSSKNIRRSIRRTKLFGLSLSTTFLKRTIISSLRYSSIRGKND